MIDIKTVINNIDIYKKNVADRQIKIDVEEVLNLHQSLVSNRHKLDELRAAMNKAAKAFSGGVGDESSEVRSKLRQLKQDISIQEGVVREISCQYENKVNQLPNFMAGTVPLGKTDADNRQVKTWGKPITFDFQPKSHVDLGSDLDILDFELGSKVTGSKFYFLKREGVILELALVRFAIDKALSNGYVPMITPDLAKDEIIKGTGFVPRGQETQIYSIEQSDISLIGTSEITIAGTLADSVLEESALPIKRCGISHCFRTEAGSYGKESKGLYRVHQFTKVELFQFTKPESSENALEEMLSLEESIYRDLGIPYRVVEACSADLGAPAFKKYDIEAWMPGKGSGGEYGEVTSVSNCTDYQARRLNIKYKDTNLTKPQLVHTLNGTAIAVSRALLSIMENFQQKDGSIQIPEVLIGYAGFSQINARKI